MIEWKPATLISRNSVSANVYSLVFQLNNWEKHIPGQHYDIRLTSEDGYQAERSYSVASAPNREKIVEFGVQLLDDGEVSPYLVNQLKEGEQIEIKGPLGGHFIWDIDMPGPLLLAAGGSGVVPFISMLRHYKNNLNSISPMPVILLLSSESLDHIPYYQELQEIISADSSIKIIYTLTRKTPETWKGYQRRIDKEMLRDVFSDYLDKMPMIFVCGSTPFVESVSGNLVDLGFQSHFIKTERYGG